jgi:hypothetical protein
MVHPREDLVKSAAYGESGANFSKDKRAHEANRSAQDPGPEINGLRSLGVPRYFGGRSKNTHPNYQTGNDQRNIQSF